METLLNIKELRAANLTQFVRDRLADVHRRNRYIGPALLPAQNVDGLDWEIVKGSGGIPIMANIHAMEAESGIASRRAKLTKIAGSIPNIKRKIPVSGKTLYQLKTEKFTDPEIQAAIKQVYDDTETMLAAVAARIEWLRWRALAYGAFTYSEDDIVVSVDFQMPTSNKVTVNTLWSDTANADWVADLMNICDTIEDATGVRPTRAVCSRKVLTYMLRNTNIASKYVFGSEYPNKLMTLRQLNQLLTEYSLPQFVTYDVKVRSEDVATGTVTEERLLPESRVILLPPSNVSIGNTLFAPTLSALLNSNQIKRKEAPGIYAEAWVEGKDNPTLWTKAEANAFPTVPGIDYVGILTVLAE